MGLHLRSVEIAGPYNPAGADSSPSRRRIFSCTPRRAVGRAPDVRADHPLVLGPARLSPSGGGERRRAAAGDVPGGPRAGAGFRVGHRAGDPASAGQPRVPVSRRARSGAARRTASYRISDLELASRLSFFLWSSIPDESCSTWRRRRQLSRPAVLEAQVTRMLADPRADAFVENFAGQWLYPAQPAGGRSRWRQSSPTSTRACAGLRRETELFFDSIVREDRGALDLLHRQLHLPRTSGWRGTTACPDVKGSHFRRVTPGCRLAARRAARPRQHPDRDVAAGPHLAGRARQVDAGELPRHVAAAAAAQRAGAQAQRRARRGAVDARADGGSIAPTPPAPAATR